jgi:hypothetical protein
MNNIKLHLRCLLRKRGHDLRWHAFGVLRELRRAINAGAAYILCTTH